MHGPWAVVLNRLKASTDFFVRRRGAKGVRGIERVGEGVHLVGHRLHREKAPDGSRTALSLLLPPLLVAGVAILFCEGYRQSAYHTTPDQMALLMFFFASAILVARSHVATVRLPLRITALLMSAAFPLWFLGCTLAG